MRARSKDTLCKIADGCDLFIPIGAPFLEPQLPPGVGLPTFGRPSAGAPGHGGPSTTTRPPRPATTPARPPRSRPPPLPPPTPVSPLPTGPTITVEAQQGGADDPFAPLGAMAAPYVGIVRTQATPFGIPDWLNREMLAQTMPQVFEPAPPVQLYAELPPVETALANIQPSAVEYSTLESLGAPPPAALEPYGGNLAQYMQVHPLDQPAFEAAQVQAAEAAGELLPTLTRSVLGAAALLVQTTDAGLSAAQEAANVESQLTNRQYPIQLNPVSGLPASALEPVTGAGPFITVEAPPAPDFVPIDTPFRLSSLSVGSQQVSRPGARARPTTSTQTDPQSNLGEYGPSRFPGEPGYRPTLSTAGEPTALAQTQPQLQPFTQTPQQVDQCEAPNQQKKKDKKKKKKPRQVCYRGTYVELKNGLIKHRKERIQCR